MPPHDHRRGGGVRAFLAAPAAALLLSAGAQGAINQSLSCDGRGWMRDIGTRNGYGTTNNYFAGLNVGADTARNYLGFVIPTSPAPGLSIVAATLRVNAWIIQFSPGSTSVDYTLWDTTLSPSFSANAVAWADLGGGNALGFHAFTAGDDYQVVGIALNTAGLTALNSATGTTYLFGGSVAIAPGATLTHAVFTRSQQTPAADVTLDLTWDEIPAPGAGALVALGGLMAARRRRGNGVSA